MGVSCPWKKTALCGATCVVLFTAEQYDPNAGFYYLRARWMNPETGRFITTDPFEGIDRDPVSLHKYLYAANNPVMFVDPSGEYTLGQVAAVMGTISLFNRAIVAGYAGVFHLASNKKPILWKGGVIIKTGGWLAVGGGLATTMLESECIKTSNGKWEKSRGAYGLILGGFTLGPPLSVIASNMELKTPGTFGINPYVLCGPASWSSGTGSLGVGYSATEVIMGMGWGFNRGFKIVGVDVGFDVMQGFSIPLPLIKSNIPCAPSP